MGTGEAAGTFDFTLPSLGADMDTGKVIEWCVEVGDTVGRGDTMCVVHTEKSDIDVEIWHGGVVEEFLVELGEEIDVGTPIARIRGDGAAAAEPADGDRDVGAYPAPDVAPSPAAQGTVRASPYARRLAAEKGLDLDTVRGTGPGGAVVAVDLAAVQPPTAPAGPDSMRRLIAERMSKANRDIPHYHLSLDVDVDDVLGRLSALNETLPIAERILPAALYVHAVGRALARHPEFNGFWVDGEFRQGESVKVAMAISLRRGGLVTPHVEDADRLDLGEIMARLTELVAAARRGNLKARWMTGSTITITNLGELGADRVHGVISPPQIALVGVGRPRQCAWVVDGEVVPRTVLTLTLAADHRATDGMAGSRFLTTIADNLQRLPEAP